MGALAIQKDRDRQMASINARREKEKELAKQEAEELVLKVKKEDEQDKLETEQRRLMRKERVQKALQDSCAAAAQKEEALKNQIDREDQSMEDYRQRVIARDKKCQEDVWQKVVVRRQMLESAAATRYMAEQQRQDETETKAARERAAKDAKDIETEKAKAERLKKMRLDTQKYLFEQMHRKTEVKEKAKEEKKILGSILEVDARKHGDLEASRGATQRQRAMEHRAELERQIEAKTSNASSKKDTMSACELAINKQLIERVERAMERLESP